MQQLAAALGSGWSREKVRNYSNLRKISKCAWEIIGTTFEIGGANVENDEVPANGTMVPRFSERLLRSILPLRRKYQIQLVMDFAPHALDIPDMTQARLAAALGSGWSRGKVSQYAMLQNICAKAWKFIATTFEEACSNNEESVVAVNATTVAFTENLLRSLLPLRRKYQIQLVTDKDTNPTGYTQEKLGEILGWGISKVKQYSALKGVCDRAWGIVTQTTVDCNAIENSDVTEKVTNVTFSEGLLRAILPLRRKYQIQLVTDFAPHALDIPDMTQARLAAALGSGWSRDKVQKYALLQWKQTKEGSWIGIAPKAWEIVTQNITSCHTNQKEGVTSNVTPVTFTEGLLRSLLPLRRKYQIQLVTDKDTNPTGYTQETLGEILGWSREKVRNYSNLRKISKCAWEIIGTAIQVGRASDENSAVPENGTSVPFTENLLRSILPLRRKYQFQLVTDVAKLRQYPICANI